MLLRLISNNRYHLSTFYLDLENYQSINFLDLFFILPEIYLILLISLGIIIISMSNFKPLVFFEKKIITIFITNLIILSLFIVGCTYAILIILNLHFLKIAQTYILFNGYAITDFYTLFWKLIVVFTAMVILKSSKLYIANHPRHLMEYPIFISLTTFFLLVLIMTYNFITIFIAIVGFSLNIYVLLLYDSINQSSREAGIKYYFLSSFSTGLLIGGIFIIFFFFQSTNFLYITWKLNYLQQINSLKLYENILTVALYFLIIGFLFKLAAFPCHLWAADTYEGSPHPITVFFVLPIKVAVLTIFLRVLMYVFIDLYFIWNYIIWLSSFYSMLWGGIAALTEKKIKRFMAYSSINQMGFLLMGLACGTFEGLRATLIFLIIYVIMNIGFFIFFLLTRNIKNNRSMIYLTDFNYAAQHNWNYTIILVIILFSMAGIPPLGGFFGKYFLFFHAFSMGYYSLVIMGIVTSLISTFYYLRIVKIMWFETQPKADLLVFKTQFDDIKIIYLFMGILLIFFLLVNTQFFNICNLLTKNCLYPLT
jgi:NADH-quinone oxidoreductase subunit N